MFHFMEEYAALIQVFFAAVGAYCVYRWKVDSPTRRSEVVEQKGTTHAQILQSSARLEHELEMMPHSSKELEANCGVCTWGKYAQKSPRILNTDRDAFVMSGNIRADKITSGYIQSRNSLLTPNEVRDLLAVFQEQQKGKHSVMYLPAGATYTEIGADKQLQELRKKYGSDHGEWS